MRSRQTAGLMVSVLVLWAAESPTQGPLKLDGNALLRECTAALRAFDDQRRDVITMGEFIGCSGYIRGFTEGYLFNGSYDVCPPAGISPVQLTRVIVEWLRTHPALLHMPRPVLTHAAFAAAFPCPSSVAPPQEQTPSAVPGPPSLKAGKGKQR